MFVSPTTLLSTLKIVHSLWRQEKSFNNSEKIALEAGKLYDKMSIFYDEFCRIGDQINRTKMTYDDCTQKLKFGRGNILSRFDHIKKLGAKKSKKSSNFTRSESRIYLNYSIRSNSSSTLLLISISSLSSRLLS